MKALVTLFTMLLGTFSTCCAQNLAQYDMVNGGIHFLFIHTRQTNIGTEFNPPTGEVKDHRFTVPVLVVGYGKSIPLIMRVSDVTIGFEYNGVISMSIANSGEGETSSSYFRFGADFALLARTGAGNGMKARGFGFGGGIGVQTGLTTYSNGPVHVLEGINVTPQFVGEVNYAPTKKTFFTLRLSVDAIASVDGSQADGMGDVDYVSMRQAGFQLRFSW